MIQTLRKNRASNSLRASPLQPSFVGIHTGQTGAIPRHFDFACANYAYSNPLALIASDRGVPMPITQELLDRNRRELLDLSVRNRLLSIPVNSKSARLIHIRDELTSEIFRILRSEKKTMSFLPGRKTSEPSSYADDAETPNESESEEISLPQPDEEIDLTSGLAKRHVDSRLQTNLTSEGLQSRLLALYRDAQTMMEEQGVNILYLALGQLKWLEAESSDTPRYAPLILLPVELLRRSASERFYLCAREEEVQENLSLAAKLDADFALKMPPFPTDDDFDPIKYLDAVAQIVAKMNNWEVLPNTVTLGFFSFAKFLMYRDLDSANWRDPNNLLAHPGITALLQDGFVASDPPFPEDADLDELIPVEKLDHVVDADSSQTIAIEMVRRGRSLVIQGPPGTGKSQSITNIVATAVLDGKRVLFVAEKLAALEVVKRRLEREGLGPLCLELHSNKSNKHAVIDEIGRTWKLGRPKPSDFDAIMPRLSARRITLNTHAASLHTPLLPSGFTPFFLFGRLAVLGDRSSEAAGLTFDGAEEWTVEERNTRRSLVGELCERIAQIGLPCNHPWRGVQREAVLKIDFGSILTHVRSARDHLAETQRTTAKLARLLCCEQPLSLATVSPLIRIGEHVARAPALDRQALCNDIWTTDVDNLRQLLTQGRQFAAARANVGTQVIEAAWSTDFRVSRMEIAGHGQSLFRLLFGDYRQAIAEIRSVLSGALPKLHVERLALVDQIIAGQQARQAILTDDPIGREAFGDEWKQENTDWDRVAAILDWHDAWERVGLDDTFCRIFANISNPAEVGNLAQQLATQEATAEEAVNAVAGELQLDISYAFACSNVIEIPFAEWTARFALWLDQIEELTRWTNYFIRMRRAERLALAPLVSRLADGTIAVTGGVDAFDRIYLGQLLHDAVRQRPELAQFDGDIHSRCVTDFKQLDRDRLVLAKHRVLAAHYSRLPPSAGVGASGIVRGEMERKRGHRSVRRLLKDAGAVVQAIKPVFMMSPLSVAQFLEPGAVEFDLLVIDEASQVQPVDALGAIARSRQVVVVGDRRQLPPTRFFSRITSDTPDVDEEAGAEPQSAQARDIESILGLCQARGLPDSMLRWHYRSRHHSLIAVSNQEFYDNKLFIVPSPWSAAAGLGLKFNHVSDGIFDRGGTSVNRVEAKAICRAILVHARQTPHLSLGVAAFSLKQQQAILDELELLRRENPDAETFFNNHATEPFFVKNLENVQGDERDVMFISVGYGRDRTGYMAMNFGPLGADGGERRLNVLISRAKQRCEVFSSITADDIDLERAKGRGVHALKTFLAFAQTGRLAIAERTHGEEQSPLEESVRQALESLGHEVHTQVGLAGFFIDLAIVDREQSGRYILGIECDGASYHSSRSARDRDRLRQAVLEDHGWIIHRIWSTDWFQRRNEQISRLGTVIEEARIILAERAQDQAPQVSLQVVVESADRVEREVVLDLSSERATSLAKPYEVARVEIPRFIEPHVLSTRGMADVLLKIVRAEGPIHEDEIVTRVRELWGLHRAGSRIQDAVAAGIRSLLLRKQCAREDDCLFVPDVPIPIRDRSNATSPGLHKPDLVPPMEVRATILAIVTAYRGAAKDELPVAVARTLGFKTTSPTIRSAVQTQIRKLLRSNALEEDESLVRLPSRSPP